MADILTINNLQVSYGGINAVKGISMSVPEGKIVTLIGANGAGKSTILKAISGIVKPKSAEITWKGENIVGKSPDKIVKSGIVLVPEGRRVFPNLTVKENLKIGAYLRKDDLSKDFEYVYRLFPRLKEREWQLAGTLSGGEQQMLAVGRALMSKPELIMMDEPSLGLAPLIVQSIFDIIRTINKSGITVLLIEQNANMALQVADKAYVIETGRITLEGTGAELVGKSPDKIVQEGVVLVPEGRRVFPNLTVKENLKIGAYLRRDSLADDFRYVYTLFPRLKEREWQLAGTLSGGEQQMLAVGRALMSRPKLLMMDEPSLGLAPLVVQGIFDIIRTINQQGVTVLLIEQNANMALKVADRAYVLETGLITKTGTGAELLADESIKEAYLGKKKAH